CNGADISPPLKFEDIPDGTSTLALIVDDPDAPAGTFVHWVVWNINPTTMEIPENSVPAEAAEGTTDFNKTGWGGPCPPDKEHRYYFKLYALDTELKLPETTTKKDLETAMEKHILAKAELMGRYDQPR
ncbi:YbhB/YbcL family Raf kinase inhibitor-like protein, partial [Candidatus Peregrinibacteria bacterium]|nr:YbhB/YbcL family Raf kinase inhibitor-like protein [Candidatus Peregrinibacteria bacterium]